MKQPLDCARRLGDGAVFPRIRAGASLKPCARRGARRGRGGVFPRIRAGASLKLGEVGEDAGLPGVFSPAFVRGPH